MSTQQLAYLLGRVPDVYATLEDTMVPARSGGEVTGGSPDPLNRPAPAHLDVVEHRHKLLRGLRWWVDAIKDPAERTAIGDSVLAMCGWLAQHMGDMDPGDQQELATNLHTWLGESLDIAGGRDNRDMAAIFPAGAADAMVPQATAAKLLGVPVSTVWRRNGGKGGDVRLGDVARCDHTDLPVDGCAHCALSR